MTLIITKNAKVADLFYLNMLVLRFIYEKENMTPAEIRLMQDSIVGWAKKFDLTEEERGIIQRFAWMLDKEEKGGYNERKENFKRHGINWRKFHRLPTEKYGIGLNKAS